MRPGVLLRYSRGFVYGARACGGDYCYEPGSRIRTERVVCLQHVLTAKVCKPICVETYLFPEMQCVVASSVGTAVQLGTAPSGGCEIIRFVAIRHLHAMFREPALRVVYACV
jgi:hypothetical protein